MYVKAGTVGTPTSPYGSLAEWTKGLAKFPLIAQPGTEWNYSLGTDVLGRLVEVRGGPHPLDRCSSQLRWNPGS